MRTDSITSRINHITSFLNYIASQGHQEKDMIALSYIMTANLSWSVKAVLLSKVEDAVMDRRNKRSLMIAWGLRTRKHRRWFRGLTK